MNILDVYTLFKNSGLKLGNLAKEDGFSGHALIFVRTSFDFRARSSEATVVQYSGHQEMSAYIGSLTVFFDSLSIEDYFGDKTIVLSIKGEPTGRISLPFIPPRRTDYD